MPLFWKYGFEYKGLVRWFYAAEENEARRKYFKLYGVEAGPLVTRERW